MTFRNTGEIFGMKTVIINVQDENSKKIRGITLSTGVNKVFTNKVSHQSFKCQGIHSSISIFSNVVKSARKEAWVVFISPRCSNLSFWVHCQINANKRGSVHSRCILVIPKEASFMDPLLNLTDLDTIKSEGGGYITMN